MVYYYFLFDQKNIDLCHVRKCQILKIPENYIIYYRHKNILMIDKILQLSHGLRINIFFLHIIYSQDLKIEITPKLCVATK
jgi:hypothetical protein